MESIRRTALIFKLDDARFGVDATRVGETVWLPELTPVEELPDFVVGVFSLRGQIVPVIDLNLRFGHPAQRYSLNNQIVVLELNDQLLGLIVAEVIDVIEFSLEEIRPPPDFDAEPATHIHLIEGEIRVGDDLVTLLETQQLLCSRNVNEKSEISRPSMHFFSEAKADERAILRERAIALMDSFSADDGQHLALAVVELEGEYFGIELHAVLEFCDIAQPSPIPCCPSHILGAISLRGNLLILLDLRSALNLSCDGNSGAKAVIVRHGEHMLGVAVKEVHDVIYLRNDEIQLAPAALREHQGVEIKGTAHYDGKMIMVLDLPVLLNREEWVVNQTV